MNCKPDSICFKQPARALEENMQATLALRLIRCTGAVFAAHLLLFLLCQFLALGCQHHIWASEPAPRHVWKSNFIGSPEQAPPLKLERAFPKLSFSGPISIHRFPDGNRYAVLEQHHKIYSFEAVENTAQSDLLVDFSVAKPLSGNLPDREKRSIDLFSIAFHPNYRENHLVYLCYVSTSDKSKTHVSQFQMEDSTPPRLLVESEVEILTCDGGGHNGCTLLFDQKGYLYISLGDLAEPSPPDRLETGQDISDLYSSILRIDVDHPSDGRNYSIPSDNPFIGLPKARPEVFAFGFRNPFRMSFDSATDQLWVGDVGWEAWEMVYRVRRGGNYGWAVKEGPGDVKSQPVGPTPILPADIALGHNEAASVTGGLVYHGKSFPELSGNYIFGDWITRKFWAATFNEQQVTALKEIAVGSVKPICFEVDEAGELLILDYNEHQGAAGIYRFARNPAAEQSTESFPRRLSQTGLFADTSNNSPSDGVFRYNINASMWQDGASAEYLVAVPTEEPIRFYQSPQKTFNWFHTKVTLPIGTVLAKTLSLRLSDTPLKHPSRIETQVSLKDEQGEWQFYTYRWNEQGTDADLVPAAGGTRQLSVAGPEVRSPSFELDWQFASRSQCRVCHTPWTGETIGFTESQLRRPQSQSDAWHDLQLCGVIQPDGAEKPIRDELYSALVNPYDSDQPIDRRARSYLHANCAHCHMNGGNASTVFRAHFDLPIEETLLIDGKILRGDFGIPSSQLISPGKPPESVLQYRLAKIGTGRMPPIGSERVDAAGVKLIRQWVDGLPEDRGQLFAIDSLCGPVLRQDDERRLKAARTLLGTRQGTLELSMALAENRVPQWLVHPIVGEAMEIDDLTRRDLIEPYASRDQQVPRLGLIFDTAALLQSEGDITRGMNLFNSGASQCSQCHRIGDIGKEIGPDLSRIADKLKTEENILKSILQPSAEIDDKYRALTVLTSSGHTHVGQLVERNDQKVVLRDAQGKSILVEVDDIEIESLSPVSLMPEGLLAPLTVHEAADLLAYLHSLR